MYANPFYGDAGLCSGGQAAAPNHDLAALYAAADTDSALCTLVGIEGSFSRRRGAQIAVGWDGWTVGSLSDGCLEQQLITEARIAREQGRARLMRFGAGSPLIDFRLPCGGGLDILIDPAPDRTALKSARDAIAQRRAAGLPLSLPEGTPNALLRERLYQPPLRIMLFGEGPELTAFEGLARAACAQLDMHDRLGRSGKGMSLGQVPDGLMADPWTAIVLLFHDHEWERSLLRWAIDTPAFYIGAQGGAVARAGRTADLLREGVSMKDIGRIRSPVGLIPRARQPEVLALSVLAEIVAGYEQLHPHP